MPLKFIAAEVDIQGERFLRLVDIDLVGKALLELGRQLNKVVRLTEVHYSGSSPVGEEGFVALFKAPDRPYEVSVDIAHQEFGLTVSWSDGSSNNAIPSGTQQALKD